MSTAVSEPSSSNIRAQVPADAGARSDQATENTPLLLKNSPSNDVDSTRYIKPEVERILALPSPSLQTELLSQLERVRAQIDVTPRELADWAYCLIVLLHVQKGLQDRCRSLMNREGDYAAAEATAKGLDIVREAWKTHEETFFRDLVLLKDLERFMLTSFPLSEASSRVVRLIDLMSNEDFPEGFLRNPAIETGLLRIWRRGDLRSHEPVARHIAVFITPRANHLLDLTLFLSYFVALVHYAVQPPLYQREPALRPVPGLREVFIMIYAFGELLPPWSAASVPSLLTLLAYLTCLPSVPRAQDVGYSTIHMAVALHLLQLHLPRAPSPLLLLPFDAAFPLATLIQRGIFRIFIPVIVFFIPALVLAAYLLSEALSNRAFVFSHLSPSPIEARTAFFTLLTAVFILLLFSLMMFILVYPHLTAQDTPSSRWDRYSRPVGLEARRALAAAIAGYSQTTYFPAPFNLVQISLVLIPFWISGLLGKKHSQSSMRGVERILWLVLVAPLSFVFSGLYLWGYAS